MDNIQYDISKPISTLQDQFLFVLSIFCVDDLVMLFMVQKSDYAVGMNIRFHIERRAETHERFYMIEVHRHRFARRARKVPFEKCEHWRKVCGRSAKDQIASTL